MKVTIQCETAEERKSCEQSGVPLLREFNGCQQFVLLATQAHGDGDGITFAPVSQYHGDRELNYGRLVAAAKWLEPLVMARPG